jgi:S-adenosylmethionine:tRNA ribosyltransferase-isomerase
MQTSDFDYQLPPERIAQEPLPDRAQSRMLVLERATGIVTHRHVDELPAILRAGDLLVMNDTRVVPARVFGRRRDTGGRGEVLLIEPSGEADCWLALCRFRGKLTPGIVLDLADAEITATIVDVGDEGRRVLALKTCRPLADILEAHGLTPVPPYIRRDPGDARHRRLDRERYQTVFAREPGAVAAPTAGLHFSAALLDRLAQCGIAQAMITLHVGPGTFRPVKVDDVTAHRMDAERYSVGERAAAAIGRARAAGGRIVAVGTTTVRTLETVARQHGRVMAAAGRSELFIHPPYTFRAVDCLLTNFHLPRSTLLMMICAFAAAGAGGGIARGRDLVLGAYEEAIHAEYRFYSYGDCMLLL